MNTRTLVSAAVAALALAAPAAASAQTISLRESQPLVTRYLPVTFTLTASADSDWTLDVWSMRTGAHVLSTGSSGFDVVGDQLISHVRWNGRSAGRRVPRGRYLVTLSTPVALVYRYVRVAWPR